MKMPKEERKEALKNRRTLMKQFYKLENSKPFKPRARALTCQDIPRKTLWERKKT